MGRRILVATLAALVWAGVAWAQAPARTAVFLGATGEDYVSTSPFVFTNGVKDWHLRLTGLRAVPATVMVLAVDSEGRQTFQWVTKGDGVSWAAWMQATPTVVDLWIEPHWAAIRFDVTATYADGSTELVAGILAVVPPPEPAPPPPPVPPPDPSPPPTPTPVRPLVIDVGVPACALATPPCVTLQINLVPVAP